MTIDVDPDWWKTLFDEVYLVTDARSVGDEDITRQEIDIFLALVPMQPDDRILDLCGGHGRHTLELCQRGFRDCTVLDYSQPLLDVGARVAAQKRYRVRFVQGDARQTELTSGAFDHVLILGKLFRLHPGAGCRPAHPAGESAPPQVAGLAAAGRHRWGSRECEYRSSCLARDRR